jgi:hypothetical protein
MRLNRYETSVLVKMAKELEKDVDKRTGALTVQLKKGPYGLIQSARLWYEKLSGDLRDLGFEANKSDECVFNRTEADGSQTTLVLHVDDVLVTAKTTADVKRLLSDIGKGPGAGLLGHSPIVVRAEHVSGRAARRAYRRGAGLCLEHHRRVKDASGQQLVRDRRVVASAGQQGDGQRSTTTR